MAEVTSIIWHEQNLDQLLHGKDGPVAAQLAVRLTRATNAAKINASGRPGPRVRTGRLRSSITWALGTDSSGLFGVYGTNVPYGYPLETGLRNGAKYPFLVPAMSAL